MLLQLTQQHVFLFAIPADRKHSYRMCAMGHSIGERSPVRSSAVHFTAKQLAGLGLSAPK